MTIKTHILFILFALVISACASKENVSVDRQEKLEKQQEEYSRNEAEAAGRFFR